MNTNDYESVKKQLLNALNENDTKYADKDALEEISSKYNATLPQSIKDLFHSKINHSLVIDKKDIEAEIVKFIRES